MFTKSNQLSWERCQSGEFWWEETPASECLKYEDPPFRVTTLQLLCLLAKEKLGRSSKVLLMTHTSPPTTVFLQVLWLQPRSL